MDHQPTATSKRWLEVIEEAAKRLGFSVTTLGALTEKEIKAATTQTIKSLGLGFGPLASL
jgi:hypothetical protein